MAKTRRKATEYLADVDDLVDGEKGYLESTSTGVRVVKVEKGHATLVRILPAQLGPRKTWFARIAMHWHNRRPIMDVVNTHPDFGGDPDGYNPVQEVVEAYLNHSDKRVANIANKVRTQTKWIMYCTVKERDDGEDVDVVKFSDQLKPYRLELSRTAFDQLLSIRRRSRREIMDFDKGLDIWYSRESSGVGKYVLEKEGYGPLYDIEDDDEFNDAIDKVMGGIRFNAPDIPSDTDLEDFAQKVEDDLRAAAGSSGRRRSRSHDDDDDDDGDEAPKSRRRSRRSSGDDEDDQPRSRSRSRSRRNDDDDDEEEEAPKPKSRRKKPARDEDEEEEAPKPKSRRKKPARDEDDDGDEEEEEEAPKPKSRRKKPARDEDDDEEPAPTRRAGAKKPARDEDEDDDDDGDGDGDEEEEEEAPKSKPPRRKLPELPARGKKAVDDDDDLPDDDDDPVPPGDEEDDDDAEEVDDDPEPKKKKLSSRLRKSISSQNDR